MENQKETSFTFEIDNISEKESEITSQTFVAGGCEWVLSVYPKGELLDQYLSLFLQVANPESLRLGWKRKANFIFTLMSQSGKQHAILSERYYLFCAGASGWGLPRTFPLTFLKEKGFLENNKLIVEVKVKVLEVVHQGKSTENEIFHYCGFHILSAQIRPVYEMLREHPDTGVDFRPKSKGVKTAYMNVLLGLIETLKKPPKSFSETELSNARSDLSELAEAGFKQGTKELCELMEQGFKLDWLESKLEEVSLERKKTNDADGSLVKKLEERVKNLELMESGSLKSKVGVVYSAMKISEVDDECRALELEERFMKLERMMKKLEDADVSRIQQFEEHFKNLELMQSGFKMDCLKSKLEEVSLEMKNA
ncbi:hypothetical protein AALP_AA4G212900 [Arabis alpina]|uniref:MATH domain-containing protein n=1 Tax=Arabis alpina TaxID=50452 RepID=A0A087H4P7_ARAAL|nr:hypothetical protein AALP_AA4G212900 [Arabis alpina]